MTDDQIARLEASLQAVEQVGLALLARKQRAIWVSMTCLAIAIVFGLGLLHRMDERLAQQEQATRDLISQAQEQAAEQIAQGQRVLCGVFGVLVPQRGDGPPSNERAERIARESAKIFHAYGCGDR